MVVANAMQGRLIYPSLGEASLSMGSRCAWRPPFEQRNYSLLANILLVYNFLCQFGGGGGGETKLTSVQPLNGCLQKDGELGRGNVSFTPNRRGLFVTFGTFRYKSYQTFCARLSSQFMARYFQSCCFKIIRPFSPFNRKAF